MPLDPGTGLIMFIVGGIGAVASFNAFSMAEKLGPHIEPNDLLPMLPPHPPLPRFIFTKPELLEELRRR